MLRAEVLRDENALSHCVTVKLGTIAYVTDGQHGYHEVDEESSIRHITANCVRNGIVRDATAERLAKKTHDANPRSQLKAGDVLLSTAGTLIGLENFDASQTLTYTRRFADVADANRFGAEYFMPCKQRALDRLALKDCKQLGHHCESVRAMFDPNDAKRGEQVRNFDLTD